MQVGAGRSLALLQVATCMSWLAWEFAAAQLVPDRAEFLVMVRETSLSQSQAVYHLMKQVYSGGILICSLAGIVAAAWTFRSFHRPFPFSLGLLLFAAWGMFQWFGSLMALTPPWVLFGR